MVSNFEETAMETIEVSRDELKVKLQENLGKHKREYVEAMEGFVDKRGNAMRYLAEAASTCNTNSQESRKTVRAAWDAYRQVINNQPVDRSESYKQAIILMEWQKMEQFEISINDFECYVRDNWSWSRDHNTKYLSNRS